MRTSLLSLLALAPAVSYAQNATFLTGLVTALQGGGLTQTINVATSLNGTTIGQQLLGNISSGTPFLLFAPSDTAWTNAPANVTSNQTLLTDVFAYHVVQGNFAGVTSSYPNTTVGETLLNDPEIIRLEGGRSQALVWAVREDNQTHILNQRNDTMVTNVVSFENLTIAVIDHVLNVPESLENTIPTDNVSLAGFELYLQSTQVAFFNDSTNQTSDVAFFDLFNEGYPGFTLFVPNTSAVEQVNDTLQNYLATNRTAINAVMWNHFINATTLYSPQLSSSQNYTSQGGEVFSFAANSTGQYVTQGNVTALIVQPDVLLPNGVIHVVDAVFLNADSDPNAAVAALSSAVSAQSTATASQTGPLGPPTPSA